MRAKRVAARIAQCALALLVAYGGLAVTGSTPRAFADTGGYPWAGALCSHTGLPTGACANYDWGYKNPNGSWNLYDQWGYGFRNCTSWVAWRLSTNNGYTMPHAIGNANNWDNYFTGKVPVDGTPKPGAIAQTDAGSFGHVAYVESVSTDGTHVTVSEYNEDTLGDYDTRIVPTSTFTYIHVKDITSTPPTITTSALPDGVVGSGYSAQLTATGGTSPYSWSVVGGSLPPGLSLNPAGLISGVPSTSGSASFTVQVAGADGAHSSGNLVLVVRPNYEMTAVRGANNSLDFYWNQFGTPNWGERVVAGTNTTYSTPSVAVMSNGEVVIAARGANNSLDFYWNQFGTPDWGHAVVAGTNTTYSAPSLAVMFNGYSVIGTLGANNSLDFYWNQFGTPDWGLDVVAGKNTTYSAPSLAVMFNGYSVIGTLGANNSLDFHWNQFGTPDWGLDVVAGKNTTYSAPSLAVMSNGYSVIGILGANNSLDFYWNQFGTPDWGLDVVAGKNTTYSAPSLAVMSNGYSVIGTLGANNSLDFYWNKFGTPDWGKTVVGGPNTTYSAPSLAVMSNGYSVMSAIGPKQSLDFYWNKFGTPDWGKTVVGGPNTTYSAPSIAVLRA